MNRRRFILALTAVTLTTTVAQADYVDDVVGVLEGQGYHDIDVTRTLLGRTRILATNGQGTRELILNARTGEVLRDVWVNAQGQTLPGLATSPNDSGSNTGSGGSGGGRGDDDDGDDSDDHGGHGGDDDDDDSDDDSGDDDSGDDGDDDHGGKGKDD